MRTALTTVILISQSFLFGGRWRGQLLYRQRPLTAPQLSHRPVKALGALMLRVLADRAGVENVFDATATPEALEGAGSLIVVIGASMKGLGAAGINIEDEFARIRSLLSRAQELNIPVIAARVEGGPTTTARPVTT